LDKNQPANISIPDFWVTVVNRIEKAKSSKKTPIAVIDIDGTIALHYLRTREIFRQAVKTFDLPEEFKANLANYDPCEYDYYPRKNLLQMGLQEDETLAGIMKFWDNNFFSNRFLHLDKPVAGAREFMEIILNLGVNVFYLSGRDDQNMGDGTRAWLKNHNFMGDHSRTSLFLKADLSITSVESKIVAGEKIKSIGEPALIIDNEPGELEALWRQFPQAVTVLLDTPNSGRPGNLPPQTLKIKNYLKINSLSRK
jgi:hypothetical protein